VIRALRPYGDDSTSVGDALRRAAPGLGVEADGRSIHDLAERVVVAAEAEGGATAG
jgi:hypothetical protein